MKSDKSAWDATLADTKPRTNPETVKDTTSLIQELALLNAPLLRTNNPTNQ